MKPLAWWEAKNANGVTITVMRVPPRGRGGPRVIWRRAGRLRESFDGSTESACEPWQPGYASETFFDCLDRWRHRGYVMDQTWIVRPPEADEYDESDPVPSPLKGT